MKRYLLFAGDNYYPSGGWRDLRGSFDSLAAAQAAREGQLNAEPLEKQDWAQIIDLVTGEEIK